MVAILKKECPFFLSVGFLLFQRDLQLYQHFDKSQFGRVLKQVGTEYMFSVTVAAAAIIMLVEGLEAVVKAW